MSELLIMFGHRKERRGVRRDGGETEEWGKRGDEEKIDDHELVAVDDHPR